MGGEGGVDELGSPFFPFNWFENLVFRGGVPWKRTVLNGGGGAPASQDCPLSKNRKKTGTNTELFLIVSIHAGVIKHCC